MNKRSLLGAVVWVGIGFGCVGNISQPGGGSGGNAVGGGPTPADKMMMQANADLFAVASTYFPSTAAATPSKRMARLTRTQRDLTTKTLLPAHVATAAMTALPPDPLQTNYEYAANLAFTPANFTPYTKWVDGITASVRAHPASVIDGLFTMGTFYAEKFAGLLAALKGIDDGNGQTALYNSAVILGMECWSNSSSGHYLTDIPFILAGQGAGKFQTGRIVDAQKRNNNDLLISVQNACGIASSTFGLASLCKGPIV